jgi:hypothetical protein
MIETLKLNGTGKFCIDDKQYDCFIKIDLIESSISLYGDFENVVEKEIKYSQTIFDFFKTKTLALTEIKLDSNYGEIKGEINNFFISGVKFKGLNFITGSIVAQLFHIEPNNNYDEFKISPRFSKLSFSIDKTEKIYNELWFKIPNKAMNFREDVITPDGKELFFFSDNDIVILKCRGYDITDIEIDKIRSALSFIIGTEIIYIYGFRYDHIEINNRSINIKNKGGLFPSNYKEAALSSYINYVYGLNDDDYYKFENSLYLYLSAKSASLSMNSLLSLLFICIESLYDGREDTALEIKINQLFNLCNPKRYDITKNTISMNVVMDQCHALSKIRNMIMHEGISADKIFDKIKADSTYKSIVSKCDNNCIELWFYIITCESQVLKIKR